MCLSAVYREKIDGSSVVVQEASSLTVSDESTVRIKTLFGEETVLSGYYVREVNLLKNYVILAETNHD
ncbi:MAG: hypothetical protein DRP74_09160 [Candidatus Omnitrophota bacterium]|nr:MAG: hypothetical protein DRP74_09160 [Candidatus Omnitrophota bacterium]